MKDKQQVYIFDTTLRDGQQSPGAGMSFEDNLAYAQHANNLGIDILEAGFPSASKYDFKIVQAISKKMAEQKSNMKIAALCQLREEQVIKTMESLEFSKDQKKAIVHTYVPVDPNLMKASLGQKANNYNDIINQVNKLIKIATDSGFEAEFTPEGYSKIENNFDFTTDVIRAAVDAGANIINCPDTIGGACKWQGDNYFVNNMQKHADIISKEFPNKDIIWSTHCHNDLGLALDNSMNAVFNGPARQIEGCINGIGERAGNVAIEQCVLLIDKFGDSANSKNSFYTNANLKYIKQISDFVADKMLPRQPHWPISGDNAAKHTSGGHTNAILKNPEVYQPFDPKTVGDDIRFSFGPLSGSNHAKSIIEKHGFTCSDQEKVQITQTIKDMYYNRRKGITDEEFMEGYNKYIKSSKKKI